MQCSLPGEQGGGGRAMGGGCMVIMQGCWTCSHDACLYSRAVPGGSAPNPANDVLASTEDLQNSIPNSPGSANQSQGPLSPKTPTAMRSTSQVRGWDLHAGWGLHA